MPDPIIRVVLADAHRLVRVGLRSFLTEAGAIIIVAEAESGTQAFDLIMQYQPDVAVLDDQLPDGCCVEVTQRVRATGSTIGILVLITFEDSPYIKAAIEAGANGFVLKSAEAAEIIEAVHAVYDASCVVAHLRRKEVHPHQ